MPFVIFDDFCMIPGRLEIILWDKMIRSLAYKPGDFFMKIMLQHTFQNANMKFPDISLTFAPFQNFPDIWSNSLTSPWPWKNNSLTFPWRVATLYIHISIAKISLHVELFHDLQAFP